MECFSKAQETICCALSCAFAVLEDVNTVFRTDNRIFALPLTRLCAFRLTHQPSP